MFSWGRAAAVALCSVLVGLVILLPTATGASTKTITLGSTDPTAAGPTQCPSGQSWVQRATTPTSPRYRVPANGTITSWTTSSEDTGNEALKIWAPTSKANVFKPVAESATEPIPTGNGLTTFATHIRVAKGDLIGLAVKAGLLSCLYNAASGDITSYVAGDPSSGRQKVTDCLGPGCTGTGGLLNVSASFTSAPRRRKH